MEKRVEYGWLLDFYGALLTEHRLRVMRMYLEEDLSLQEIADAMGITRQGVHDAINHAQKQLEAYEAKLGLLSRYRRLTEAVGECRTELDRAISGEDAQALVRAREALRRIEDIERCFPWRLKDFPTNCKTRSKSSPAAES